MKYGVDVVKLPTMSF